MSYVANFYNYATPPSSVIGLINETSVVADKRYFTLFDNTLDGSYAPITGDVGFWGSALSGSNGELEQPFVVTVSDEVSLRAFRLTGSRQCYPVKFRVKFFNGNDLIYTIEETDNNSYEYLYYFPSTLVVTKYEITIEAISAPNAVARLYNVYGPDILKRFDAVSVGLITASTLAEARQILSHDTLSVAAKGDSYVHNNIVAKSTLAVRAESTSTLHNIHAAMKSPSRKVYGKVYITYTDSMLDSFTAITSDFTAYNSNVEQILDGLTVSVPNLFTLYENDLTGRYVVSDAATQVGWTSSALSNDEGVFENPPSLKISFEARPLTHLPIVFDDSHGCVPKDFTVTVVQRTRTTIIKEFVDNHDTEVLVIPETIPEVLSIEITVHSCTRPGYPVTILDVPIVSTLLYEGYQDTSRLIRMDLLEELTYEDDIEALGGISANEVTVVLDNSAKEFFFNNAQSPVSSQLKRNRRIEPWLGAEVMPGEIEWHRLGTFWSYSWDVPVNGLSATVIGFDTIGLLDTTDFHNHVVQIDKSIGELIEYILEDAKKNLAFIEYSVDSSLYDIRIPYAWFDHGSHTAALRKISMCYPMHVYCDRNGVICAAPQRLHRDYYYDTWSDSTNVKGKTYSSLYTTVPNIVNVVVKEPVIATDVELVREEKAFSVIGEAELHLNFTEAYLSDIVVTIVADADVSYTYEAFSWGISLQFKGFGSVSSIVCVGTSVTLSDKTTLTRSDTTSVKLNGAVTRDISADFIQTQELGALIINRLFALAEFDRYDATVNYRGDIALAINDPILLLDGIAPDNRYTIKRHELSWDGSLTGSAELNT